MSQPQPEPKLGKPSWILLGLGGVFVVATAIGIVWAWNKGSITTSQTKDGVKTDTTKSPPSDTLLTAILVIGAVLMLTGVLWSRIKSISLPGGSKLELDSDEVGKTKDAVAKEAEKAGATDPQIVATATSRALPAAARLKSQRGELDDEDFLEVAAAAVQSAKMMWASSE